MFDYKKKILIIIPAIILVCLPLFVREYLLKLLVYIYLVVGLSGSFDLVRGYVGLINLGHSTFFAIGAYGTAISAFKLGISSVLSTVLGPVSAFIFAIAIGAPLFRLRGGYFTMATLALVLLLHRVVFNLEKITGGWKGIMGFSPFSNISFYFIFLAMIGIILGTHYFIGRSKLGLILRSIREDEDVAEQFGVKTLKYKLFSIGLNGFFSGVLGSLYFWYLGSISPEVVLGLDITFLPATSALFGGPGVFLGPLIGALSLGSASTLLSTYIGKLSIFCYGAILTLTGIFLPLGVVNTLKEKYEWMPSLVGIEEEEGG